MIAHADPYTVMTAFLAGLASGSALVGWAMVRREREHDHELRRAERRLRGR